MSSENGTSFNRGTGLIIIEVRCSNPNGDPDAESEPRTFDADGRGLISPVSYKRKLRDMVLDADGPAMREAREKLGLKADGFDILEKRGRSRDTIFNMSGSAFNAAYWDGRVFGNTFLEDLKGQNVKQGEKDHFISTGVVQFGPGVSIAPVEIVRTTNTNKSGVEADKDRGMAPLGWRVVRHGLYVMPFFVNPMMARRTGCASQDIDLMKFLVPHAYRATASAIRPFVEVRHAWYAEHKSPLGSCPDSLILDSLQPKKREKTETPSLHVDEYDIPRNLPDEVRDRLNSFEDLGVKQWEKVTTTT